MESELINSIQVTDDFDKMASDLNNIDYEDKSKLLPKEYFDNEKFMLACVGEDGKLVQYASERLKNSRDFALKALEVSRGISIFSSGFFLNDMSDEVRNDRDFYLRALQLETSKRDLFYSMGETIKQDKEVVLSYAQAIHDEICDDPWKESKSNQTAHEKYEDYLRHKPELIECARKDAERPNASETDRDWFERLNSQGQRGMYCELPSNLLADKTFAIDLVAADPGAYLDLDRRLKNDTEIALQALKVDPQIYPILDRELLEQKDFAQQAVKLSPEMFHYLGDEIRADREVFKAALSHPDFKPLSGIDYEELAKELSTKDYKPGATNIEPSFLFDRELVIEMGKKDKDMVAKASFALRNDPEVILETGAFEHMSDRLKREVGKNDPEQTLKSIVGKNKLERELAPKDSYEEMMKKLGLEAKAKQEQSITRSGSRKL